VYSVNMMDVLLAVLYVILALGSVSLLLVLWNVESPPERVDEGKHYTEHKDSYTHTLKPFDNTEVITGPQQRTLRQGLKDD